jgi:predicted phosphodiesterase
MRYLIISDIHANLEALEAVMAASAEERIDATLVLGDLVGYGADPNAVVARVRAMPATTIIRGNHDKVGAGIDDVEGFNPLAKHAIEWTAAVLTPENRRWLAALPAGPTLVNPVVEICHGAPFDEDCYLFDELDVRRALASMQRPLCLFGHTHVPAAFRQGPRFEIIGPRRDVRDRARGRRKLPGELRRGRTTARRRPARRVRRLRNRGQAPGRTEGAVRRHGRTGQDRRRRVARGARPTSRVRAIEA